MLRSVLILGLLGMLVACDRHPPNQPRFSERDSAGVRLVVNRAPAWSEGGGWHLDAQPTVVAGGTVAGTEAATDTPLYGVTAAVRMPDGRTVIANAGSHELRIYSPDGTFLRAVGQQGEGPGEFERLTALRLLQGDTLLVYDGRLRRFSYFDAEGAFQRSHALPADVTGATLSSSIIADDLMLTRGGVSFGIADRSGLHQPDYTVSLYELTTRTMSLIGTWPGTAWWVEVRGRAVAATQVPLAAGTQVAGDSLHLYAALGDRGEIQVVDHEGRLLRIVRLALGREPVTDDLYAHVIENRLAGIRSDAQRRRTQQRFDLMDRVPLAPVFQSLVLDALGYLWVGGFAVEGYHSQRRWHVVSPEGHWLGSVPLPTSQWPLAISRKGMLVLQRDELGVESVLWYGLIRA